MYNQTSTRRKRCWCPKSIYCGTVLAYGFTEITGHVSEEEDIVFVSNQTIAVAQATIHPDDGELSVLDYSLRCTTGPEGETLYRLRVDKRCPNGNLKEREETAAITSSLDEAMALAKAFAAGTVPPCVLLEMVDDWLNAS